MSGIEDLAERQDGVVSLRQAIAAGLTVGQISRRRRQGRYRRCRRGVVQIASVPPSWRQAIRIAVIAAGERVVVSHASAVRLYGLELPRSVHPRWRRDNAFLELAASIVRHVRLEGVRGHRSYTWELGDVRHVHGIAVTSPLRTIIDLSSRLGVDGTGRLLDQMVRRKLVTMRQLVERIDRLRPAPGRSVRVLRIVASRADGWEADEPARDDRLLEVIEHTPPPSPGDGHWVRRIVLTVRFDSADPQVEVYVEGERCGPHRYPSDLHRVARRRTA